MTRRTAIGGMALLLGVLLAYLPALRGEFIWDDSTVYITDNPTNAPDGLVPTWTDPRATPQYFPLTHTVIWAAYQLWGRESTFGYHLVNALLHAASAFLFWRLLAALAVPGAFLAAGIFALHPVHVESVAWISEIKNTLSGVFFLGTLLLATRSLQTGREAPGAAAAGGAAYGASLVLFACALLSKSTTVMIPVVLVLIIWHKRGRFGARDIPPLLPYFALGAAAAAMSFWAERNNVGAAGPEFSWSLPERFVIAGRNVWFYAEKLLWPTHLSFIPRRWTVDAGDPRSYLLPAAVVAALAALWLARRRIGRGPVAAAAAFLVLLFPNLGFFNFYFMRFSFVQDHYQYLPSLGPIALGAALATGAAERLAKRWRASPARARALPLLVLLPVLGIATWRGAARFADEETLWRSTIAENPEAWLAHHNLATVLIDRGAREEALAETREAIRIKPDYCDALVNLGSLLIDLGRTGEGIAQLREALATCPQKADIHYNLGVAAVEEGRLEEAEDRYRRALAVAPGMAAARNNLAHLLERQGRAREAAALRTPRGPDASPQTRAPGGSASPP